MGRNLKEETLLLRNPDIEPTDAVLKEALGPRFKAYTKLVDELKKRAITVEWQFYRDGTSWLAKGPYRWTGPKGGKREINTLWLSVWEGFFHIAVYLSSKEREEALELPVDAETLQTIATSPQMGKLNTFPVGFDIEKSTLPKDVLTVIDYKLSLK